MSRLKAFITSHISKKNWHIRIKSLDGSGQIEVTDPSFLFVDVDDLLIRVIELAFGEFGYLSINQFVDREQWNVGEQDVFIRDISLDFSLPIVLTYNFESSEEAKISDRTFVLNIIGHPEKSWLKKIVRFGMTNNPNIFYGLRTIPKNWLSEITAWNIIFRKWFDLAGPVPDLGKIAKQVDLFGWTEDGHLNFVINNLKKIDELLEAINRLAEEKGLILIIENKDQSR